MCLMLYLAAPVEIPLQTSPDLTVEDVLPARAAVLARFSLPHVKYIGSHSGCSCGFPSIQSNVPVDYFDGMLIETNERDKDLRSVRALLDLIRPLVSSGGEVQMYPIWDLEEHKQPIATINWHVDSLNAEKFFFHEQFLHRVLR